MSQTTSTETKKEQAKSKGNLPSVSVLKFGGTSVKNIARIQHVAEIVKERLKHGKVLVVVSAMGDTTDYLLKLAHQCAKSPDQRELDSLLSTGEHISITLLSMMLKSLDVSARSVTAYQLGIFTENVHNKARIIDIKTDNLAEAFQTCDALVVAGFQGVTANGDITTLGRGGSDTTAVALAAAAGAKYCDIYTDVDGIYTSDPNKIPKARLLERISYGEVVEMARLGAQVIHPRAVELARQYGVILRVRNTFKPDHEGTSIDGGEGMEIYRSISGVATDKDQACVTIMDVPDQPGIAARVVGGLAKKTIVVDMIMQAFHPTAGLNNITFTVASTDLPQTIKTLEELKTEMGAKAVHADEDIAKVSLVGAGMAGQPDVAARLFETLGAAKINIKMISSSEMKITCVVSRGQADKAAKLIHDAFELEKV
ncbi:MAG TPA: aspartate kinase [Candidatus Melainabacteria bacterium]|nr:aspartate kinase [Candidatus Melainabacteria bacterium]